MPKLTERVREWRSTSVFLRAHGSGSLFGHGPKIPGPRLLCWSCSGRHALHESVSEPKPFGFGLRQAAPDREEPLIQKNRSTWLSLPLLLQASALGLVLSVILPIDASPGQEPAAAATPYGLWPALALAFLTGGIALLLAFRRWPRWFVVGEQEQTRTEQTMRRGEDYYRVFHHASDGFLILDPDDLSVLDANQRACEIYGLPREMLVARSLHRTTLDTRQLEAAIQRLRSGQGIEKLELKHTRFREAVSLALTASLLDFQGKQAVFCSTRDISGRKALETQLNHQAFHDPLTGLANRALFKNRVEHAFSRAVRSPQPITVLYLDLDNFKKINDSLGHDAGDQLLIEVARRILACVRINDTVARLGGDEFAVLLDATNAGESIYVAERILRELPISYTIDGNTVVVGTSIGIAESSTGTDADDLLRNADAAMYMAKGNGKGRYVVFENEVRKAQAFARLTLPLQPLGIR